MTENPNKVDGPGILAVVLVTTAVGVLFAVMGAPALKAIDDGHASVKVVVYLLTCAIAVFWAGSVLIQVARILWQSWRSRYADEIQEYTTGSADPPTDDSAARIFNARPATTRTIPVIRVLLSTGIAALIVAVMASAASRNGDTQDNIVFVSVVALLTMLALPASLIFSAKGHRIIGSVTRWGGLAVMAFWAVIAVAVLLKQVNFKRTDPAELSMVAVSVMGGAMALVIVVTVWKIQQAGQGRCDNEQLAAAADDSP